MNERIRELAERAFKGIETDPVYATAMIYASKELEKFAELIAKECVDILMKPAVMESDEALRSELSDYNRGWVSGRLLGIEHIKEHFGVDT